MNMERKSYSKDLLFISILTVCSIFLLFSACTKKSEWKLLEKQEQQYYMYEIVQAPAEYEKFNGEFVCRFLGRRSFAAYYTKSCEKKILKCLAKGDFEIRTGTGRKEYILLPPTFEDFSFTKEELNYIWDILSENYAGFDEMEEKGFTKAKLLKIKNGSDFYKLFDKCVNDGHFAIRVKNFYYDQGHAVDPGTYISEDSQNTYFEKQTSNAYYIRFTNCRSEEYFKNFANAVLDASKKDFIILDARSNYGGDNSPISQFRKYLNTTGYKGTVICLQDNWSFSSGEIWHTFGTKDVKINCLLVGTHSGGLQRFDSYEYDNEELNIHIAAGLYQRDGILPDNWLGELKGYEPQIWATTDNMKETLEGLGVDLGDVVFR